MASYRQFIATDAARALLLAVVSLAIGGAINRWRTHPLAWNYQLPAQRLRAEVATLKPHVSPGPRESTSESVSFQVIDLEEFRNVSLAKEEIVIDARAGAFYRLGHIPGALSLPRDDFAREYARQKGELEADRARPMVVYCSESDCPDAEMVARALVDLGHTHLRIYKEGWEEWTRAGLPQETGAAAP